MMRILSFLVVIFFCNTALAQRQGIKGQLYWVNGNQMPGPEKTHIPRHGVAREIYVYELTSLPYVEMKDGFYKKVHTRFVKSGFSKPDGSFKIKLPPGRYSVFVKENKGLFANIFDSENNISPVTVESRKYSWITITIDYQAVY